MTVVLNWIKAHLLIVLFSAIVLIVFPLGWFFSGGQNSSVQSDIQSRVRNTDQQLKKVEDVKVKIQPLTPGVEAFDRNMVISETVLDEYRMHRETIKKDADAIITEAISINRAGHESPLVPGLLPAPERGREEELPYKIHNEYIDANRSLLEMLNAGEPLDPIDLAATLDDFRNTYSRTQLNQEIGMSLTDEERDQLRDALTARRLLEYRQHAEEISVYASEDALRIKPWDPARGAPAPHQWFDWEHETWVKTDLAKAINLANSDGGVTEEPFPIAGDQSSVVKRIIEITIDPMYSINKKKQFADDDDQEFFGFGEGGAVGIGEGGGYEDVSKGGGKGGGREYEDGPGARGSGSEVTIVDNSDPASEFQDDFANSISGRGKNGLYDIRDITTVLIVDSTRLPALINAIQQTNFMTVAGVDIEKVDALEHLNQGYFYGNAPVVKAIISIESLWLRDWTVDLMPTEVKEALRIPTGEDEDAKGDDG